MKYLRYLLFIFVLIFAFFFYINFQIQFITVVGLFSYTVCILIFVLSIFCIKYERDSILSYLGTGFLPISILLILFMFSFRSIIDLGIDQESFRRIIWTILGYCLSIAFLYSVLFMGKRVKYIMTTFTNCALVSLFMFLGIKQIQNEVDIQSFLINLEIFQLPFIGIFVLALLLMYYKKEKIGKQIFLKLYFSVLLIILAEVTNFISRFFIQDKYYSDIIFEYFTYMFFLFAFILILELVFDIGVRNPYDSIFKKLNYDAKHDNLTGLINRQSFFEIIDPLISSHIENKEPLSFCIIDLDNFKEVNDKYGHLVGDQLLREFSSIISSSIREIDFVARYGGEEFVFIFKNTKLESARITMERIKEIIENHKFTEKEIKITLSGGLVQLKRETAIKLISRADFLLYKAKDIGKNQIMIERY